MLEQICKESIDILHEPKFGVEEMMKKIGIDEKQRKSECSMKDFAAAQDFNEEEKNED